MTPRVTREQVLSFRIAAQQLDRDTGTVADTAVLDIGVQDTGPDGGPWALAVRGADASCVPEELATVWSLRGAPHVYRQADLPSVATAVQPYSEADAAKRIFDAVKPLKAGGVTALGALDTVARRMRSIVIRPMVKGAVSTALTAQLDEPYLRYCRPCQAIHCYEMPFRLGALRGGLQLQAGTSRPVLERIGAHRALQPPRAQHHVVRAFLHLLGPATPRQVSSYLDAPPKDVQARWPADVAPGRRVAPAESSQPARRGRHPVAPAAPAGARRRLHRGRAPRSLSRAASERGDGHRLRDVRRRTAGTGHTDGPPVVAGCAETSSQP